VASNETLAVSLLPKGAILIAAGLEEGIPTAQDALPVDGQA
jgi:hypothetical protein